MGTNSSLKLVGAVAAALTLGLQARASDIDRAPHFDVDVAIVFAVDFSSSIDPDTADLQRNGHVAALTSPEIINSISGNHLGCIAVTYFEWASPAHIKVVLPWVKICGPADAESAAQVISKKGDTGFSRRGRGGTSISSAIGVGSLLLDQFPGSAERKVIDISANGENNDGYPVQQARNMAVEKGYTINAIAIPSKEDEDPGRPLASYFADNVIGGFQAFVMEPRAASDYTTALRRKLAREIALNSDPYSSKTGDRIEWRRVTAIAPKQWTRSQLAENFIQSFRIE
ncbi:DUF1194 domain-containing protein [Sinorhizobium sp. BG8]|uniref:DUF1194 domain-containing protein n=1 Tax=Sinorhizobium sp. BG8 TaxID=2613773 RepID=UPI00193DC267|nr:DUF1194 domain-containing protein [Sinorhizobium sp. BG8]QRM57105.1 DUF1194 domain-containing protein [Sinorhizobium sp. BG8]